MSDNDYQPLASNSADYVTASAKAVLGAVPFAGSLLTELAGTIIPNQRIDRIAKFAIELDKRVRHLDRMQVDRLMQSESFTDLMEETLRQAARSTSDERRQYLAALLASGMAQEAITSVESKHLLRLLGELNDIEVIWLRAHEVEHLDGDREFRSTHRDLLKPGMRTSTVGRRPWIGRHCRKATRSTWRALAC